MKPILCTKCHRSVGFAVETGLCFWHECQRLQAEVDRLRFVLAATDATSGEETNRAEKAEAELANARAVLQAVWAQTMCPTMCRSDLFRDFGGLVLEALGGPS